MAMVKITRGGETAPNERWIINEHNRPERWFVDSEGDVYVTLRKLREPRPDTTRIMTLKKFAYKTMQEAEKAVAEGVTTTIRHL